MNVSLHLKRGLSEEMKRLWQGDLGESTQGKRKRMDRLCWQMINGRIG